MCKCNLCYIIHVHIIISVAPTYTAICLYAYMPIFHNPYCLYADPIRYCLCEIYSCIYNCSHVVQC